MIISRAHRILFIHIQKTGGSSIERHLADACPDSEQFIGKHATVVEAKTRLGEAYADYFTFSFVRNPWDRLVSWYNMIRAYGPTNTTNQFWAYVLANSSCFEEFIRNCTETVSEYGTKKSIVRNQIDYLSDDSSDILVDETGRFECFADDGKRILASASITVPRVHHQGGLPHEHYSTYYTEETRDIVASRFRKDIEAFGYEYEEAEPSVPGGARQRA